MDYAIGILSPVGAFIALCTIFLIIVTIYLAWRVYVKEKYRMLSKEEQ